MAQVWCSEHDQPGPEESNPMFYSLITRSSQSCLVCRFGPRWHNVNMNHDSAASSFLSSKCVHSHQCILSRTPGDISICDETRCLFSGDLWMFWAVFVAWKVGVFSRRPGDHHHLRLWATKTGILSQTMTFSKPQPSGGLTRTEADRVVAREK